MTEENNIKTNVLKESDTILRKRKGLGKYIHSVLDGSFLTMDRSLRFIPYLLFLSIIGIIYIANIYYAEKTMRNIEDTKKELKDLNYEWTNTKSKLSNKRMQSEVAKRLEKEGIKPLVTPPSKLIIKNNKEQ